MPLPWAIVLPQQEAQMKAEVVEFGEIGQLLGSVKRGETFAVLHVTC